MDAGAGLNRIGIFEGTALDHAHDENHLQVVDLLTRAGEQTIWYIHKIYSQFLLVTLKHTYLSFRISLIRLFFPTYYAHAQDSLQYNKIWNSFSLNMYWIVTCYWKNHGLYRREEGKGVATTVRLLFGIAYLSNDY